MQSVGRILFSALPVSGHGVPHSDLATTPVSGPRGGSSGSERSGHLPKITQCNSEQDRDQAL